MINLKHFSNYFHGFGVRKAKCFFLENKQVEVGVFLSLDSYVFQQYSKKKKAGSISVKENGHRVGSAKHPSSQFLAIQASYQHFPRQPSFFSMSFSTIRLKKWGRKGKRRKGEEKSHY